MTGTRPARAAWPVLVAVNALLAVGAAVVLVPWLVVLKAVLAELGMGSVDPTLVDDGLTSGCWWPWPEPRSTPSSPPR